MDPIDERIIRFEHHIRRQILAIAEQLAGHFVSDAGPLSGCGFFILSGVSSYFETINQFLTGQSSEHQSKAYFRQGFKHVYPTSQLIDPDIDEIYSWIRCGMHHSTMPKGYTFLDRNEPQAFRKNGDGIIINPAKLVHDMTLHFEKYMVGLKDSANASLRTNFNRRAEKVERSIKCPIVVSSANASSTTATTTGTPNPMMSGGPLPPAWQGPS